MENMQTYLIIWSTIKVLWVRRCSHSVVYLGFTGVYLLFLIVAQKF